MMNVRTSLALFVTSELSKFEQDFSRMLGMQRILIIGPGNAGKSTLANRLGKQLDIPVYHLDKMFWKPGWEMRSMEARERRLRKVLKESEWIIDGNFQSTLFSERIDAADSIVHITRSRFIRFSRWLRRLWRYRGVTRPDMGEGNVEVFDREYVRWMLSNKHEYPNLEQYASGKPVFVLRNQRQVETFLEKARK